MLPSVALAKLAVNVVASLGVAKVIGDIVVNNTIMVTTTQKVLVNAGGFVLGSMVMDQAATYVNKQFDAIVAMRTKQEGEIVPEAV